MPSKITSLHRVTEKFIQRGTKVNAEKLFNHSLLPNSLPALSTWQL